MERFVRDFTTSKGDALRICMTEDKRLLSQDVCDAIGGIHVMGIELLRVEGLHTIGLDVLQSIEDFIYDVFSEDDNAIILYYCDFLNPIPKTSKNTMPCQEYRSRLFENMFKRYTRTRRLNNVRLSVVAISGINETYYFHLIYRDEHARYATIIGADIKDGLSK